MAQEQAGNRENGLVHVVRFLVTFYFLFLFVNPNSNKNNLLWGFKCISGGESAPTSFDDRFVAMAEDGF
jgi:hypothetical protein